MSDAPAIQTQEKPCQNRSDITRNSEIIRQPPPASSKKDPTEYMINVGAYAKSIGPVGVSIYSLMYFFDGPHTVSSLSRSLSVSRQTIQRALKTIKRCGFLNKVECSGHPVGWSVADTTLGGVSRSWVSATLQANRQSGQSFSRSPVRYATPSPPVVVVGSKEVHQQTTTPEHLADILGTALSDLNRIAPGIHPGQLLGHYRDAVQAVGPEGAVNRLQRAIWYTVRSAETGIPIRNPLAVLRNAVREGLAAYSPAELKEQAKKQHSNAKTEDSEDREEQNRKFYEERAKATIEEVRQFVLDTQGILPLPIVLEHMRQYYKDNPHVEEVYREYKTKPT